MRTLALLFTAALMISLASCGGNEKKEDKAQEVKEAVEQKADEVKQEAQEAVEQKAEETKAEEGTSAAGDVDGGKLYADSGCTACHKEEQKSIGPSMKEIAAAYSGKEDQLIKFLKGESEAIVDPAQFAVMQPNLEITKKMDDGSVKAIADYIMSFK